MGALTCDLTLNFLQGPEPRIQVVGPSSKAITRCLHSACAVPAMRIEFVLLEDTQDTSEAQQPAQTPLMGLHQWRARVESDQNHPLLVAWLQSERNSLASTAPFPWYRLVFSQVTACEADRMWGWVGLCWYCTANQYRSLAYRSSIEVPSWKLASETSLCCTLLTSRPGHRRSLSSSKTCCSGQASGKEVCHHSNSTQSRKLEGVTQ